MGGFFIAMNKQILTTDSLSPHLEKTPEGYLLCRDVVISRTGTFDYQAHEVPSIKATDGAVHMTRTADELFSNKTIASFEGKPVVISHDNFVDPSNWQEVVVGVVTNVRREGESLVADLLITAEKGIELVESGKLREVSCGYDADAVDDGNGNGHQVGIVGNHVALVDKARCGSTCKIKDGTMDKDLIARLRKAFESGDKDEFESALAAMNPTEDEDPAGESDAPEDEADEEDIFNFPEDDEGESEETEDEEPEGSSLEERIAALEKMVARLSGDTTGDEEPEEAPEEPEDEQEETVPSDQVRELIADAQEICEGMKTPAADSANGRFSRGLCERIKRKAIAGSGVAAFGDAKSLEGNALDVAFKACLTLARSRKNPTFKDGQSKTKVVDINARNRAFWQGRA